MKLSEQPQAEPSALEKQWSWKGSFFSWLIQETPFSHHIGAKNLRKITPWVSYFWKMTIIQENTWAKFSITAIYSQLCGSTKRQIKHTQYFANMYFKTALQDIIAVVPFFVQSNYTEFTSISFYHTNSCHSPSRYTLPIGTPVVPAHRIHLAVSIFWPGFTGAQYLLLLFNFRPQEHVTFLSVWHQ